MDLYLTVWEAVVPGCAPAQCLSCRELPAGCPLLQIWNYLSPFAVPVDPVQAIMHVCSAIKEALFVTDTHRYGGKVACVHVSSGGF